MKQRDVWNKIASHWRRLRNKPHELVEEFLADKQGLILDVGCGAGRNLLKGKKYMAFDFSENQILQANEKIKIDGINASLLLASADAMPFKDKSFDSVIVVNVLHAMQKESMEKCAQEIMRVMKIDAKAFISVWNKNQPRFFLKPKESYIPWKIGDKQYMRYYYLFDKQELKRFLEQNGFKVLKIFSSSKKAFKLFPKDIIAIIEKP